MVEFAVVEYGAWKRCARLTNGVVEVLATLDAGPRILRYGFVGGQNLLKEYGGGPVAGDRWHLYGGHRLWHAPEDPVRTYCPDNQPVHCEFSDGLLHLVQPVESATGIEKRIDLSLADVGSQVELTHHLVNRNLWEVELAPWALSVMAPGGRAIIPHETFAPHTESLLPARPVVLWSYTDMADPRWTWGTHFIQLRQDPARGPQKIGVRNSHGWAAYALHGEVFVKQCACDPDAAYPDFGSNMEFFTNQEMLEVESLGPIARIAPGEGIAHRETWSLYKAAVGTTEEEIATALAPLV